MQVSQQELKRWAIIAVMAVSMAVAAVAVVRDFGAGIDPATPVAADSTAPDYAMALPQQVISVVKQDGTTHDFVLEIAAGPDAIRRGLMWRKDMAADAGMIFLIATEPRVVSFWMKNTLIPLDMLFIDKDGTIVHLHENAEPESLEHISSVHPVVAVVELNGGTVARLGIKTGDRIVNSLPAETADE